MMATSHKPGIAHTRVPAHDATRASTAAAVRIQKASDIETSNPQPRTDAPPGDGFWEGEQEEDFQDVLSEDNLVGASFACR